MEDAAVGFAAAAHTQLAEPASRVRVRRRRPRRLHDDARGHLVHRAVRRRRGRPGAHWNDRHRPAAGVGRVRRHDQRGVVERLDGRAGDRVLQRRPCPRVRRQHPGRHRRGDRGRVPEPGPARRRWRADGRSVGDGHPARRRDPPLGPPGHDRRRSPRARPAHVPGTGHPALDGRHRHDGRALRRGRRHRSGPPAPVLADRRHAGTDDAGSQRTDVDRGAPRRTVRRDQRRAGAVLRVLAQRVRDGRPQARPLARRHRRVGDRPRARR